jgi:hypothetical protein
MPSSDRNSSNSPGGGGDDDAVAVARIAPKIIDMIHQSMDATNNQESTAKTTTTTTKPAVSLEYFPPRTVEGVQVRYINDHEKLLLIDSRVCLFTAHTQHKTCAHKHTEKERERESLLSYEHDRSNLFCDFLGGTTFLFCFLLTLLPFSPPCWVDIYICYFSINIYRVCIYEWNE